MASRRAHGFWKGIGRPVFRAIFGLEAAGLHLVPAQPPYIIAANHPSYLDPLFIGALVPDPPQAMAWDLVFRIPVLRAFVRQLGAFPVAIGERRSGLQALRSAEAILQAGGVVMIFPEGERSHATGEMKRPHPGIGRLATNARCPIVCVSVLGSWRVWSSKQFLPSAAKVRLVFHEPIHLDEEERSARGRDRDYHQEIATRVDARIRECVDRARLSSR